MKQTQNILGQSICSLAVVLIGVEVVHGVLRTWWLAPRIGDFRARQGGVFTGSLLIVAIARLFIRWLRIATTSSLIAVGLSWLALTVAFEPGFGHFVFGRTWRGCCRRLQHFPLRPTANPDSSSSRWLLDAAKLRGVELDRIYMPYAYAEAGPINIKRSFVCESGGVGF